MPGFVPALVQHLALAFAPGQEWESKTISFLSRLIQITCFPPVLFYTFSIPYFLSYFSIFYHIFLLFPATFERLLRAIKSLQITFALLLLTLQDLVKPVLQGAHTFKLNEIYLNEV